MEIQIGQICERCREIDFDSIFDPANETPPTAGLPIKPVLKNISAALETSGCPLCRLLAAVRFPREPHIEYPGLFHLRAISSLKIFWMTATKARVALNPSVALELQVGNPVKRSPYDGRYFMAYGL